MRSWKEKILIPEVEEVRKSLEERMRHVMLCCKEDWTYEFEIWKVHWGFE